MTPHAAPRAAPARERTPARPPRDARPPGPRASRNGGRRRGALTEGVLVGGQIGPATYDAYTGNTHGLFKSHRIQTLHAQRRGGARVVAPGDPPPPRRGYAGRSSMRYPPKLRQERRSRMR
jgi:hypothetical protein